MAFSDRTVILSQKTAEWGGYYVLPVSQGNKHCDVDHHYSEKNVFVRSEAEYGGCICVPESIDEGGTLDDIMMTEVCKKQRVIAS